MDNETPRPILVGHSSSSKRKGYFHKWFIKTYDDEPKNEFPYALVEYEDGTVAEVHAIHIQFTDGSENKKML